MVALPQTYNTADLPDTGGSMPLIPAGQYQAVIVHSELKPTSKGDGQYLALKVLLTQGQYANTEFVERLNIINPNPQAVEIAYKTLARISEALGMQQTPGDSNQLHNRPLMVEIATEAGTAYTGKDGQPAMGKDKSIIKKYLPIPGVGVSGAGGTPSPFVAPVAATAAAPQVAAAPANNPFAPPL